MFLLWEMCFIQNHPFHASRFCAGYVCEAKQTSLIWGTGSSCQSPSQSEGGHQPTKSQNMSFRHFRTFSLLKKGSEHCFSRAPKVFLRSSLVEWVVLATCQPLFVIVYEIFSLSKYNSVDIEDISLFIGFFSSGIFGETWCWRHWQELARGFSTRLQRLKTIQNLNILGKVLPCKSRMTEVPHNSCIYG